jgi:2-oxoacid:acceptor oxidoreductase gamma subunit (pyruvate/2-ketoisovalerate family)
MVREFCFYGRGGQGAVTAAQILATAAFSEGHYSQTFPKFGMERRGAPLVAFLRIDDEPIEIRGKIFQADGIVVLDSKLLQISNPLESLKKGGFLLVNSKKPPEIIKRELRQEVKKVFSVDASSISALVYGPTSIPITSVILLGSFAAMTEEIKLNSLFSVLEKFFRPSQLDSNRRALELGYGQVRCLNED